MVVLSTSSVSTTALPSREDAYNDFITTIRPEDLHHASIGQGYEGGLQKTPLSKLVTEHGLVIITPSTEPFQRIRDRAQAILQRVPEPKAAILSSEDFLRFCASISNEVPHAEHFSDGKTLGIKLTDKKAAQKIITEQFSYYKQLFSTVDFAVDTTGHVTFSCNSTAINSSPSSDEIESRLTHPRLLSSGADAFQQLIASKSTLAGMVILTRAVPPFKEDGAKPIVVLIADKAKSGMSDGVLFIKDAKEAALPPSSEVVLQVGEQQAIERQRGFLQNRMSRGEILTESAFDLYNNWPRHPLIADLRSRIEPLIKEVATTSNCWIDHQDLEHQSLFFLTTFCPSELYGGNQKVLDILDKTGAQAHWRGIEHLEEGMFSSFPVQEELFRSVVVEQSKVLEGRLRSISIAGKPIEEIVSRSFIHPETGKSEPFFSIDDEKRWDLTYMRSNGSKVLVARSPEGNNIEVEFKLVDPELAAQITFNLHYIHTVRNKGRAYGLFLKGDTIPFAVETTEPTTKSRNYKKNSLLLNGYHPFKGVELTRLYTFPGGPKNIIGVLDKMVPDSLKEEIPDLEYVTTTVMPSYAKTRSTTIATSGVMPVLIKKGGHTFMKNNEGFWEHLTTRRLPKSQPGNSSVRSTHPNFPLLPVLEVLMPIRSPSFAPIEGIEGKMIIKGF